MTKRIGFACKFSEIDNKTKSTISIPEYNVNCTTVAWLNRQSRDDAETRLWELMRDNIQAVKRLVTKVGSLESHLRMVRIGSDVLPVYTHPLCSYFWQKADVIAYCEKNFAIIGDIARTQNVRLSMHPGQFVVLASDTPDIVDRSILEFEYHTNIARWMGFGKSFQDFKINVHIAGRAGPQGIIDVLQRLTPEARNCITIENDEISWGIDSSLELANHLALVPDIHHHWVKTGEYIEASDIRIKKIIDSWRGVRPAMHYAVSREDVLVGHSTTQLPDLNTLMENGHKKGKLRAHSNAFWNTAVNEWALSFLDQFDLMCESKFKNIASFELAKQAKTLNLL